MNLNPLSFPQPLLLDIGSGEGRVESNLGEFTTVDAFTKADIVATMWEIPLPDGSVSGIYSSNALEHISKFDVIPTIREWHRLLKVGGMLYLTVPDLEWAVKFWLELKDTTEATGWPLDIIFGNQKHMGEFHKTGFTPRILWDYFCVANPAGWYVHKLEVDDGRVERLQLDENTVKWDNIRQGLINLQAEKTDVE